MVRVRDKGNAGELYRIIGAICNGSNSVDHPLRSGIETMLSILCIRGDSFTYRSSYHESFLYCEPKRPKKEDGVW